MKIGVVEKILYVVCLTKAQLIFKNEEKCSSTETSPTIQVLKIQHERDMKKVESMFAELKGNYDKLAIRLKEQDDQIISQNQTLHTLHAKIEELEEDFCKIAATVHSCYDILTRAKENNLTSGVYATCIGGKKRYIWCDMETDGGGWTVIQRRQNGNVDFYRTWNDYKTGFGNVSDEYWIGNDDLHLLTTTKSVTLRVDLQQFNDTKGFALYTTFIVAGESNKYKLTLTGYSGNISNCLNHNNGKYFSTKDRDNDISKDKCAEINCRGGWWYGDCTWANLNGEYFPFSKKGWTNIYCNDWTKVLYEALKETKMMIR